MKSLIKRKMISIILAFSLAASSISGLPMNAFAETTYVTIEAPAYLTGDGAADVWDLVAEKSKAFKSDIQIAANGMIVNGRTSQKIMSLGIKEKTKVTISADGDDATEAVSTLQKLISTFVNMPVGNNAMITEGRLLASTPVSNNAARLEEKLMASMPVINNAMITDLAFKNKLDMPRVVFYNATSPTIKAPGVEIRPQGAHCTLKYEVVEGNEDGAVTVDGDGTVTINGSKYADNSTRLVKIKVTANESKSDSYELLIAKMTNANDLLLATAVEIAYTAADAARAASTGVQRAGAKVAKELLDIAKNYAARAAEYAAIAAVNYAYPDAAYAFVLDTFDASARAAYHVADAARAAIRAAADAAKAAIRAANDAARAAIRAAYYAAKAARADATDHIEDVLGYVAAGAIAVATVAKKVGFNTSEMINVPAVKYVAGGKDTPCDNSNQDNAVTLNLKAAQMAAEFAEQKAAEDSTNAEQAKTARIARAAANACQAAAYAYKDIESKGVTDTSKARIAHLMFEVVEWWKSIFNALELNN